MGLAAQQCRLLTITGRKSDCEYQSMALSNQKISLSRNMADISNEYENSLNLTKLVYDYYGTGDTTNQVSYNLLMMPSALNNYLPITVTDPRGRVMLDSRLAQAARAAGIPEEGVNGLPSDITRNAFLEAMFGVGMISSQSQLTAIENIPYDQSAGFGDLGGINGTITQTSQGNLSDLINALKNSATSNFDVASEFVKVDDTPGSNNGNEDHSTTVAKGKMVNSVSNFNLADLLSGKDATIVYQSLDGGHNMKGEKYVCNATNALLKIMQSGDFVNWMADQFSNVLDVDGYSQNALNYAVMQTNALFDKATRPDWVCGGDCGQANTNAQNKAQNKASDSIGVIGIRNCTNKYDFPGEAPRRSYASINLNNIADAFLSYFAAYMEGLSTDGNYNAAIGQTNGQNLVTNDLGYRYTMYAGQLDTSAAGQALYYDTLFNQICSGGWLENDNITDNKYLQNMLQNGMAFITKPSDDGYYYQGNVNTDSYIKEVTDDSSIAKAEAKYNTEKAKLDNKEQTLDLKMKNLDTEISALTTEYDSVKSVISKNVEKAFKRYNA